MSCTTHADHDHKHGSNCGHVAVPHGDHVDYVHDGHLHREHQGHWDECETCLLYTSDAATKRIV